MSSYREVFGAMESSGADYVWMGLSAASAHGATLVSDDFDFFVRPEAEHLDRARAALRRIGLADTKEGVHSENLIALGATTCFIDPYGGPVVDLMTEISGPSFDEVWAKSVLQDVHGSQIRIASLRHILQSKIAANREKDRDAIKRLRMDFPELVEELLRKPRG